MSVFRWKSGTATKAALLADTSAPITAWTWYGHRWAVDMSPVVDRHAEEVVTLVGSTKQLGLITFEFKLLIANGAMYNYIQTQKMGGANVRDATATLLVYDLPNYGDEWIAVNCKVRSPGRKTAIMQPRNGLLPYLTYVAYAGTIAAAS